MRKTQQKQILNVLKTIDEAQVNGFYADCQEGAIAIGEYIENIKGEGTQTVALLEEYLDLLVEACNGKISVKTLKRHIIKVENSVKSELKPTKIEVVFLPYKISMWDSLESIYLAAKEDPDCDAYVVPIPSYELNPNGTLGKMYYDGEQYPADLGIINWQDYDIEARQPDAIFIHYAYDDMVTNSTIHPVFYSERLRQNCEQLIYVPYYASFAKKVADYNALLPGVRNAHHVIVESEDIRQSYIEHYEKYDKEYGWNGIYGKAADKFLALGSPKFDKVINSKKEDYAIPEEWETLITNPDGTKKKTILLNTHMFKWINNAEQYFKKLHHVFETFKNRNDVVLWWRPHPNTEMNFRTQCPEKYDEYKKVVDDYKTEGWGIYDDTADLHRAIAYTDAYYGDGSSVNALYLQKAKPSMLSNIDLTTDDFSIPIIGLCKTDDYTWFNVRYINALFKIDRKNNDKLHFVGSFPNEHSQYDFSRPLYGAIAENNNMLYFTPAFADEIAVYSISENKFEKIPFVSADIDEKPIYSFYGAFSYNKYVFFTPYSYPAILRLDTETNEISYFSDWVAPLAKLMGKNNTHPYTGAPLVVNSTIWLTAAHCNAVMAFDMETCTYNIYEIGSKDYRFQNMSYDGEYFWLSYQYQKTRTPIIKWHPDNGIIKEFDEIFEYVDVQTNAYFNFYHNGNIWLIPSLGKHLPKINVHSEKISIAGEFDEHWKGFYQLLILSDFENNFYIYSLLHGTLTLFNGNADEMKAESIHYTPEVMTELKPEMKQFVSKHFMGTTDSHSKSFYENRIVRLSEFIEYVVDDTNKNAVSQKQESPFDGKSGQRIYNLI